MFMKLTPDSERFKIRFRIQNTQILLQPHFYAIRSVENSLNTKVYLTVNVCSYINNTFGHKSTVDIISDFGLVELFEKVSTK